MVDTTSFEEIQTIISNANELLQNSNRMIKSLHQIMVKNHTVMKNPSKKILINGFIKYFSRITQLIGNKLIEPLILFGLARGFNNYLPNIMPMGKDLEVISIIAHVKHFFPDMPPIKSIPYASIILKNQLGFDSKTAQIISRQFLEHGSNKSATTTLDSVIILNRISKLPVSVLKNLASKTWRGNMLTPDKPVVIDTNELGIGNPLFIPLGYDIILENIQYYNSLLPQEAHEPTFIIK
jgi:hypothetical protein